jgi:hypothetical protein
MTGKTKLLPVLTLLLGAVFVLWYRNDKPHDTTATRDALAPAPVLKENNSSNKPTTVPSQMQPGAVVDVKQWLENGPKEPIEPREIHVDVELAPGSSATAEPLEPREIRVDAVLAPGESTKTQPLTPREIQTETSSH